MVHSVHSLKKKKKSIYLTIAYAHNIIAFQWNLPVCLLYSTLIYCFERHLLHIPPWIPLFGVAGSIHMVGFKIYILDMRLQMVNEVSIPNIGMIRGPNHIGS